MNAPAGVTADAVARELYAKHGALLESGPDAARQVLALAFMHGANWGSAAAVEAMSEALSEARP